MYNDPVQPQHLRTGEHIGASSGDTVYLIEGQPVRIVKVRQAQVTYRLEETGEVKTADHPTVQRLPWFTASN